jgi:cytochrome P450 family 138
VVLRTLLREFRFVPTTSRPERLHSRGVAFAPSGGGRAVVYRRIHTRTGSPAGRLQPAAGS